MISIDELPSNWSIEQIEEICTFNPKHDRKFSDDVEISFVPMDIIDQQTGTIKKHDSKLLGEVRKGYTHFADGDIIFAKITPCMENGKSAVARNLINGLACGSTEFHVLRSDNGVLPVAARKHKRSGLQTRKFLAHISCKSDWTSAHINCKQTHYYLQRACNHPTWLKLIANKPNADEEVGMLVCKVSS